MCTSSLSAHTTDVSCIRNIFAASTTTAFARIKFPAFKSKLYQIYLRQCVRDSNVRSLDSRIF